MGIQARDLRIGNLVDLYGSIAIVIPDDFNETHINKWIKIVNGQWEFSNWKPIPLTEEWLIKFGFEKKEDGGSEYFAIQIGNNLNLTVSLEDHTAGIDLEWRSQGSQIWMMIDSVHKLQNAFYALTGEELEVKS